jgi:hypothetical protein
MYLSLQMGFQMAAISIITSFRCIQLLFKRSPLLCRARKVDLGILLGFVFPRRCRRRFRQKRFQVVRERAERFISFHFHQDVQFKINFSDARQARLFSRGLMPNTPPSRKIISGSSSTPSQESGTCPASCSFNSYFHRFSKMSSVTFFM